MSTKNWNKIANVRNEQLRHTLIAAKGKILEGLQKGFPQYFLEEGESHPQPNRVDFTQLVLEMKRRDDVVQACRDASLPFQRFSFSGSCRGASEGVSYSQGGYSTVANGYGQYFWRSSAKRGETLEYEGTTWLVVWNGFGRGDAHSFAVHSLIVVPIEAFVAASPTI